MIIEKYIFARMYLSDGETLWKFLKFVVVAFCSKTGSLIDPFFFLTISSQSLFLYKKYSIIYLMRICISLSLLLVFNYEIKLLLV